MARYTVFMTDKTWDDLTIERDILSRIDADLVLSAGGDPVTVCEEGRDCDAVMVLFTPMPRSHLQILKRCKLLVRMGTGLNSVDLAAATELGIAVCNVPDYCHEEVADHTMALLLEMIKKVGRLDGSVKSGVWDMSIADPVPRLRGKTFGILGCGRIGRITAARAASFGMIPVGFDPFMSADVFEASGIKRYEHFAEFLSECDVVSLHAPLTRETMGMINGEALRTMKPTAYLINTARGGLLVEEDLYEALATNVIAGAALDVLVTEPPENGFKLSGLRNIVITPHAGWNSEDAIPELRRKAAEEVVRRFTLGVRRISPTKRFSLSDCLCSGCKVL